MVWGRLSSSEWAPTDAQYDRFASAMVFTFHPAWTEGLELGAARFFHLPWRDGGPTVDDALRPFEGLLKSNLAREQGRDSTAALAENQIASVFVRWLLPDSHFEAWLEVAKEDHSWSLRDLLLEPDHELAFVLGAQKVWMDNTGAWTVLRAEILSAPPSHLAEVRVQELFYYHYAVKQGHTNAGQILGAPAAYGGAAAHVEFARYGPRGRWSVWWDRAQRNEGTGPDRSWVFDVQHSLGWSVLRFSGPLQVDAALIGTWNLNRNLRGDAVNLSARLGLAYRPGGG